MFISGCLCQIILELGIAVLSPIIGWSPKLEVFHSINFKKWLCYLNVYVPLNILLIITEYSWCFHWWVRLVNPVPGFTQKLLFPGEDQFPHYLDLLINKIVIIYGTHQIVKLDAGLMLHFGTSSFVIQTEKNYFFKNNCIKWVKEVWL